MSDGAEKMVAEVDRISAKGNSAEVKKNKDGKYVVYEIQKKKRVG